jgi:predicted nucleic acid-binding protein
VKKVVVDASVAAKWVLPDVDEPFYREALRLADSFTAGRIEFIVPDLFWIEMGSVLWKAKRSSRISSREFQESLAILDSQEFKSAPTKPLLTRSLSIAVEFNRSVYDSAYIALAEANFTVMVTADEKLANAVRLQLPVVWLGSDSALSF